MDMKIAIKSLFPIMADQISKAVFKEEKSRIQRRKG